MKARFVDIKEAYDVLKDPVKRRNYDLTFDNFTYKKEEQLTPQELLEKVRVLRSKTGKLDPHRMDLDKLEFEITELLTERNTNRLNETADKAIVQHFIEELMEAAMPLSSKQFQPLADQLWPLADDETKNKMQRFLQTHTWDKRWHSYKIVFAFIAAVLLCLLIYFVGK